MIGTPDYFERMVIKYQNRIRFLEHTVKEQSRTIRQQDVTIRAQSDTIIAYEQELGRTVPAISDSADGLYKENNVSHL